MLLEELYLKIEDLNIILINKSLEFNMNFKMILDKYIMSKLNIISPDLYRFITFECYKELTKIYNFIK